MEKKYEKKYHQLERTHWWFISRREIIKILLRDFPKNSEILDLGCSGGILMKELKKEGYNNLTGIDISKEAIALCKKRGISKVKVMDGENLKFKGKFDLIIASDVLEHIENDKKAVRSWNQALKDRGKVICFVPAFKVLWSNHDVLNRHFKRYSKKELREVFLENGFKVVRSSYWNASLFFPILLIRRMQELSSKREKKRYQLNNAKELANSSLKSLLHIENLLNKYLNMPIGVSLFVVAEKRSF